MSAPTVDAFPAGSLWNMALVEPEFPSCSSVRFLLNGDPARSASCCVLHDETGETAHSAQVNGQTVFWSEAEAAASRAAYLALPTCTGCRGRYLPSDCGPFCGTSCQLADKRTFDDYDDVEREAAA